MGAPGGKGAAMKPTVILYNAVSLDGRTTGFPVNQEAFYGLAQDIGEDATLAGCDTLLAATDAGFAAPETPPTPAGPEDSRPILALVDSKGRLEGWPYWQAQPFWRDWISLCTDETPLGHMEELRRLGVKAHVCGRGGVDLRAALETLAADYGVRNVRVESGGRLNAALLAAGLADELRLLVHPVLAGETGKTHFAQHLETPGGVTLRSLGAEPKPDGLIYLRYAVENPS